MEGFGILWRGVRSGNGKLYRYVSENRVRGSRGAHKVERRVWVAGYYEKQIGLAECLDAVYIQDHHDMVGAGQGWTAESEFLKL